MIDRALDVGHVRLRALATACQAVAHWLRSGARHLDEAARRLLLVH